MSRGSVFLLLPMVGVVACALHTPRFLISTGPSSPILEIAAPRSSASCAATSLLISVRRANDIRVRTCVGDACRDTALTSLRFRDRVSVVAVDRIRVGTGSPTGDVIPVVGADDILYACREDEAAQECICIPWPQPSG